MVFHGIRLGWACLVVGASWTTLAGPCDCLRAQGSGSTEERGTDNHERSAKRTEPVGPRVSTALSPASAVQSLPLDALPANVRETIRKVVAQPTLASRGPTEIFRGSPTLYGWLLDHPDRAVHMWRRLGARCMEITDRGNGRYGWTDGQGSDVHWDTVWRAPNLRIWYAEGGVRPDPLLPKFAIRAVVVLRHTEVSDGVGRALIRHRAELYLQTDSKIAALVARMLGPSVPHLAEQGVGNMELFFSALVWYLDEHPERAEALLFGSLPPRENPKAKVQ